MEAHKLELYPTCLCRQCELEEEDNDYVWRCPADKETTTAIWKEVMVKIDEWGLQATKRAY
jgi:hypothetical protein